MEADVASFVFGVRAIERQHVEVNVEVEFAAEALHEGHRAAPDRAVCGCKACAAANRAEDDRDEDAQDIGDEARIICQAVAQGEGKREHPLTDGDCGKDAIHEMGGGVGHPAAATGRTEATAFAGELQESVLAASVAMHAQIAVRQDPAIQK